MNDIDPLIESSEEQDAVSDVHTQIANIFEAKKEWVRIAVNDDDPDNKIYTVTLGFYKPWAEGEYEALAQKFGEASTVTPNLSSYFIMLGVGNTPTLAAQAIFDDLHQRKSNLERLLGFGPGGSEH